MKYSIKVFNNSEVVDSFNFKEGFVALVDDSGNILAATSGWESNGELYVYRPQADGWNCGVSKTPQKVRRNRGCG